jgi:thymidylate synthase (FAD)
MHRVVPSVDLIASTVINREGLQDYLRRIGVEDWSSDAKSDIEEIVEVMGRGCYMSFGTELNPNITRVRSGNEAFLDNLLGSGHGSVMHHAMVSFMFTNVSRVLTHELVRHQVGVAISQTSLRYLRLIDMGMWIPSCFANNPRAVAIFERHWAAAERDYAELLSPEVLGFDIDDEDNPATFAIKKEVTSAARRVAPIGVATNIGWSCNIRALRHVIEQRTSMAAEEEIRLLFTEVAHRAMEEWPALFEDYEEQPQAVGSTFVTTRRKV